MWDLKVLSEFRGYKYIVNGYRGVKYAIARLLYPLHTIRRHQVLNSLFIINNNNHENVKHAATNIELLNTYFRLISSLEDANVALPDIDLKVDNCLRDIVITREEIVDIIKMINPNKASWPDIISHTMLKICPEKIAASLQIILNKSILQCKYPTSWKIAHVIAIF
jgi:hypothetical protein